MVTEQTTALQEDQILELLEHVPQEKLDEVMGKSLGENVKNVEVTEAIKAAHGGELVVYFKEQE